MLNKELSSSEILEAWKETERETSVYIHSPFCKEQCKFCTYKGTIFNKKAYDRYYSKYLPELLDLYKDVLSSKNISAYIFGGGTPSLMTSDMMRDMFSRIPNLREVSKKYMEFHMCDWNKEQLDVLKEYNFKTVVACVQTFDNIVLRKQGRRRPKTDKSIYDFIEYANSLEFDVMSDVIFFDTGNLDHDIERLSNDLEKLSSANVDEISIMTVFNEEGKFDKPVEKAIEEFVNASPDYTLNNDFSDTVRDIDVEQTESKASRIRKKDWSFSDTFITGNYNILGIGSYNNYKDTLSIIDDRLEYIEVGNTYTPKWLCIYDREDYRIKDMVVDFYDKLSRNIGDPPDGISFTFGTKVTRHQPDNKKRWVERELLPSVRWMYVNPEITLYVLKLRKLFPEWTWD